MIDRPAPTEARLPGADFLRAAACLTVLAHHLGQRMSWRVDFGVLDWLPPFSRIGSFGVAMFFVLSGYLLARPFWRALDEGRAMPSLRVYALRRAARIFPGYWLILAVTFVLSLTVFGASFDGDLVLRLVTGALGINAWHWVTLFPVEVNGPLWSIGFEIVSYVLMPLGLVAVFALRLPSWSGRVIWLVVIGLALAAHWLFVTYYPIDDINRSWEFGLTGGAKTWMPRYNPLGFFAIFAIGSLAAGIQLWLARHRGWIFDIIVVAIIGLALWQFVVQTANPDDTGYGWFGIPYGFPLFPLTIAAMLAVTPSSVLVGRLLDNPVTVFVARISFGIYIWHYLVIELVRVWWDPRLVYGSETSITQFSVSALIVVAAAFGAATASFYLVERPAIRWARGLERRPSPAPISATAPA
jgi:peptidoglycan/LPS O-acetylase OafA/YrhL